MPGPTEQPSRQEQLLIQVVLWASLAVGLVVALLTYADYGPTYDAYIQANYGELALRYFQTGGEDRSCNEWLDLRFYGPLVEIIPAWIYEGGEHNKYHVRHLFLGLLALTTLPAVWLLGRKFADLRIAAFAVPAVATLPRFYGHWFNNSKDTSFAVLVLWFMFALIHMFSEARIRWHRCILCGVAMGLALCSRAGGFPLFVMFMGIATLSWLVARRDPADGSIGSAAVGALPKLLVVVVVAWPIMVAPWPWAHESVFGHPIEAMRVAAKFATTIPVLFEGEVFMSDQLPAHYMAKYVGIGTPLTVLTLALAGVIFGLRDVLTGYRTRQAYMVVMTLAWLFAPLLLFAVMRPNVYGGMRHFLFVLPALGILAAIGAAGVLRVVAGQRNRRIAWSALLGVVLLPVVDLVRMHPYEVAYYNSVVGGTAGAADRYWTEYTLSSYHEAFLWFNEKAAESPGETLIVVVGAPPPVLLWAEEYIAPNVELVGFYDLKQHRALGPASYFIGTTRNNVHEHYPDLPVVHTIGRAGATFAVIKGRP